MRIRINRNKPENELLRVSFVFTWTIIMLFATNVAGVLETITGIPYQIVSNFGKASILLLLVYNVRIILKRIKPQGVLILLLMLSLMGINYIAVGDNKYVRGTIESFVMTVLPMIIITLSIEDYDVLLKQLKKISPPIILVSLAILFIAGARINQYSMGLSSSLVIPILVVMLNYYYSKHVTDLLVSLSGIFVIIILGSRGALLGIGVFAISLLLRGVVSKENRAKSILMIVIILILLLSYNLFLEAIVSIMSRFGWRSRTIYLLVNDIHHDSGRSLIYESMLNGITKYPFAIRGIAGEYNYTDQYYAHNFILELICDFGVVIGAAAALVIVGKAIKSLWGSIIRQSKAGDLELIMLMSSLPMLFVSGTIWMTVYFWTWLFIRKGNRQLHEILTQEESLS